MRPHYFFKNLKVQASKSIGNVNSAVRYDKLCVTRRLREKFLCFVLQGDVGLFEPNGESILLCYKINESCHETIMLCVLNSSQDPAVPLVHECLSFEMKNVTFTEPKKVTVSSCKRDIC